MSDPQHAREREALRQQTLVRALWGDARPGVVLGWLRDGEQARAGLRAHQAHAAVQAERALAAVYPVVQQLVGAEAFAALSRLHWHTTPPTLGDLGAWGEAWPATVEAHPALAGEPYLADVARLEWDLHQAARAADAGPLRGLALLGACDPAALRLQLAPGTALRASAHPVVSIWQAHAEVPEQEAGSPAEPERDREARWERARAAWALRLPETALVQRQGQRVRLRAVSDAGEAAWLSAVLAGADLATARSAATAAGPFDVAAWLSRAVADGLVAGVQAD